MLQIIKLEYSIHVQHMYIHTYKLIMSRWTNRFLPYTITTGDTTDPASLVTLHLYCPVFVVSYDVLFLLLMVFHFPDFILSQ